MRLSQTQPVVLVVEDPHWLDTETQTWLDSARGQSARRPLLLLVNYRPTYQHGWGSKPTTRYASTHCRPPVSRRSCRRAWETTPARAAHPVTHRAHRGQPILSGREPADPHRDTRPGRHGRAPIGSCRPCRRCRCLLPYRPSSQPVSTACRRTTNGCCKRRPRLAWTCPCPCCTRCLPPGGGSAGRPGGAASGRVSLRNAALPRRHLYLQARPHSASRCGAVLRRTRHELHRQIADVLETQFARPVETQPERLAHHYTEAGLVAQAALYWQRAGQRAMDRSAPWKL